MGDTPQCVSYLMTKQEIICFVFLLHLCSWLCILFLLHVYGKLNLLRQRFYQRSYKSHGRQLRKPFRRPANVANDSSVLWQRKKSRFVIVNELPNKIGKNGRKDFSEQKVPMSKTYQKFYLKMNSSHQPDIMIKRKEVLFV